MFEWKKLGHVFDPSKGSGASWMQEYAQAPSVVVFDRHVRVYFSSRKRPDEKGQYITRLGFIDLAREDMFRIVGVSEEPILTLGERGTFDEFGTYPASVIKTGDDCRVYYAGWTRCETVPFNAAIGLGMSYDNGASFRKAGPGPVLSYSPDEPFVLGSPKIRHFDGSWYLWYSAGLKWVHNVGKPQPVYKIRMAKSVDGIHWIKFGQNIIDSVLEIDECQAGADVFLFQGRYHMLFSYRYNLDYRSVGRGYRIGYAWSDDLFHWTRDDAQAGIEASPEGWDSESISYGHVVCLDGRMLMFYQGNEIGRYGFGLAQLGSYNSQRVVV
jgi:sucrose-6-phosphate hydrolase SacC (GH32 family)